MENNAEKIPGEARITDQLQMGTAVNCQCADRKSVRLVHTCKPPQPHRREQGARLRVMVYTYEEATNVRLTSFDSQVSQDRP